MNDRQLMRAVLVTVSTLVGLYLLYQMRSVFASLFVAIFLAIALAPAVARVQRYIKSRIGAITVVFLIGGLIVTGIGLLVIPPIIDGINTIAQDAPRWTSELQDSRWYHDLDKQYDLSQKINEFAAELPNRAGDAVSIAKSIFIGAIGAVFQVIVILVMTAFLLIDGDRMVRWLISHAPSRRQERLEAISEDVYKAVGGYVAGSFIIALIAGITSYIVMKLTGIPLAGTLAVVMGFLDLIPLVGATVGGLLIAAVAATVDFPTVLIIWAVFFLIYQQVENNVLQPFVYKRTVALHPLLVLVAVLIGSSQLGVLGALFAIPVAATLQIATRDWWRHRQPDEEDVLIPLTPKPDEVDPSILHNQSDQTVVDTDQTVVDSSQTVVMAEDVTVITEAAAAESSLPDDDDLPMAEDAPDDNDGR